MNPRNKQMMLLKNRQTTLIGQMAAPTREWYESIEGKVRNSRIPEYEQESLLLSMGQEMVNAQRKGLDIGDLFDGNPDLYIEKAENKYTGSPAKESKDASIETKDESSSSDNTKSLKFNLMIAWAAVSMVFLLMGFIGQVTSWAGQDPSPYTSISLFTLALIAGGAIVLIQVLLSFNNGSEHTSSSSRRARVNIKSILSYLIVAGGILLLGFVFGRILPVIQLSSIALIIIGIIGLLLVKPIFGRKKTITA